MSWLERSSIAWFDALLEAVLPASERGAAGAGAAFGAGFATAGDEEDKNVRNEITQVVVERSPIGMALDCDPF